MKLSSMLWAMPLAQSEGPVDGESVGSLASWDWGYCLFPKGCTYFWSLLSPSDLHPFGFGTVINFREKISSKCQKKQRVCRFSQAAYHRFLTSRVPLRCRIPAPFLLTNRHQTPKRSVTPKPITSSPPRRRFRFVSLDSGTISESRQTNKLLETKNFKHFQAHNLHLPQGIS